MQDICNPTCAEPALVNDSKIYRVSPNKTIIPVMDEPWRTNGIRTYSGKSSYMLRDLLPASQHISPLLCSTLKN